MELTARFRQQADACAHMGSPLYASLLAVAAGDLAAAGITAAVMAGNEDPPGSVPALRLMGSLHRLALDGRAPELAAHYPSTGGTPGPDVAEAMFATMRERLAELRELLPRNVQTNEVGRVPPLLAGLREIAREAGQSLRVLETGASAGLILSLLDDPAIADRRGCDLNPLDPATEDGRLTLTSFVWADQVDRLRRLHAAFEMAARRPVAVDRGHAPEWLAARLTEPSGAVPVVMHSVVMQYLDPAARAEIENLCAGVWRLSFEPDDEAGDFPLTVTPPGGPSRVMARCGGHGQYVNWLPTAS